MIEIFYNKKIVKIGQVWYLEKLADWKSTKFADVFFFHAIEKKDIENEQIGRKSICSEFHTLYTDLKQSEEELFLKINKTGRNEIRKSESDGGQIKFFDFTEIATNKEIVKQLGDMYEAMYLEKGMKQTFNYMQFEEYCKAGCIAVSAVYQDAVPIVFHCYIADTKQVRLLYSVSEFRKVQADATVIGRANKRLHFADLIHFKKNGVETYDWGGISNFINPNGIDSFKMKFGGEQVSYYNMIYGKSIIGKLVLLSMKILGKKL